MLQAEEVVELMAETERYAASRLYLPSMVVKDLCKERTIFSTEVPPVRLGFIIPWQSVCDRCVRSECKATFRNKVTVVKFVDCMFKAACSP